MEKRSVARDSMQSSLVTFTGQRFACSYCSFDCSMAEQEVSCRNRGTISLISSVKHSTH